MIDKISGWLEKQGFPLEMRTAAALRRAGFSVRQSAHYIDRGEGKEREVDCVASLETISGCPIVFFAVECKASDKPWVVLVSKDTLVGVDRSRSWGILTNEGIDTLSTLDKEQRDRLPWYAVGEECGYVLRKAFIERDDGHAASSAICKAAQYLVLPMQADHRQLPTYAISFPIIVVDSPLFECRLGDGGDLDIVQVTRSEYLFEDHTMFDAWVRIRVVHVDALQEFADEAFSIARPISSFLSGLPRPRSFEEIRASKLYAK